jgi:hypothetical protein
MEEASHPLRRCIAALFHSCASTFAISYSGRTLRPVGPSHRTILACLAAGFVVTSPMSAHAHKTSLAHLNLEVTENRIDALLVVVIADMAASIHRPIDPMTPVSGDLAREIEVYIDRHLYLNLAKGVPCIAEPKTFSVALTGDTLEVRRHYTCPGKIEALSIVYGLFFNDDPAARSIITANGPAGKREAFVDLSARNVNLRLSGDAGTATRPSFLSLVLLGVEHIVTGVDHVMFLLALLLGLPRLGQALAIVTAFTIAHSITLACAWFGLVTLPPRVVETAIALSIAYVAAENVLGYGLRYRWIIAGGFGLIHGLGFYGALSELGLRGAGALRVLFGFNLGVELGQLIIIALATPLLLFIRMQEWKGVAVRIASSVFVIVALFWALERSTA